MPAYKTICLELIQEQPTLYEELRSRKLLLTALDSYSMELKNAHEAWKAQLGRANPGIDPLMLAGEAMELAVEQMRDRLGRTPCASPRGEAALTLDAAMAYLRDHTPPA